MNRDKRVPIRQVSTGVTGLNEVLGGGLPEYSFNVIAGAPGCGKTTLAHQIMFANATPERPALFFTVMGEPLIKMLRYQQQFQFFEDEGIESSIQYFNLTQQVIEGDLSKVFDDIVQAVAKFTPGIVVVDSFRAIVRRAQVATGNMDIQEFIQRLALHLTSWEATTFLIGEYSDVEVRNNPVFTIADGIFSLSQRTERNSMTRKIQILKMRGQATVPGLHTFRITNDGLETFARNFGLSTQGTPRRSGLRLSTGISGLDSMMRGGIPAGDSVIVSGPSGSGKSAFACSFIAEGLRRAEPCVIAVFEERPADYLERAASLGAPFDTALKEGLLKVFCPRPLDMSVEEAIHEIVSAVKEVGAQRLVIDSWAGFEMTLAPSYRVDFRESLYRMIAALTRLGVTVMSTVEVQDTDAIFPLSTHALSFLADDIIRLRYVTVGGELQRALVVVKMRRSPHGTGLRDYAITTEGVIVGERVSDRTQEQ